LKNNSLAERLEVMEFAYEVLSMKKEIEDAYYNYENSVYILPKYNKYDKYCMKLEDLAQLNENIHDFYETVKQILEELPCNTAEVASCNDEELKKILEDPETGMSIYTFGTEGHDPDPEAEETLTVDLEIDPDLADELGIVDYEPVLVREITCIDDLESLFKEIEEGDDDPSTS
jgi:hypothetical protein